MAPIDVKRISKLTDAQLAQLPLIRDEWLAVGESTQPADREKAVAAAKVAYAMAGLPEPQTVIWLGSPLAGALGYILLERLKGASVQASVWDSVWASVRDSVWASVWAYTSSFFALETWKYIDHEPGKNPYQPLIDLWNRGFVPSFDGKTWRLHQGEGAKVVYEWTK